MGCKICTTPNEHIPKDHLRHGHEGWETRSAHPKRRERGLIEQWSVVVPPEGRIRGYSRIATAEDPYNACPAGVHYYYLVDTAVYLSFFLIWTSYCCYSVPTSLLYIKYGGRDEQIWKRLLPDQIHYFSFFFLSMQVGYSSYIPLQLGRLVSQSSSQSSIDWK